MRRVPAPLAPLALLLALLAIPAAAAGRGMRLATDAALNAHALAAAGADVLPADDVPPLVAPLPAAAPRGPLVHLHIPKTGGSSVRMVFESIYSELNCSRDNLSNESLPLPPAGAPCTWAHVENSDRAFLARAGVGAAGRDVHLDYLTGHVHHGMCALLSSRLPGRCSYTTVLREPVARLLSHYGWLTWRVPVAVAAVCPACVGSADAFVDALANGTQLAPLYIDNLQTRVISGDGLFSSLTGGRLDDVAPSVDAAMLRRAKHNLASAYSVIGFTEALPDYVAALRAHMGLPPAPPAPAPEPAASGGAGGSAAAAGAASGGGLTPAAGATGGAGGAPAVPVVNETPGRHVVSFDSLAAASRAKLVASLKWDLQLYEFARRLAASRGGGAPPPAAAARLRRKRRRAAEAAEGGSA